ncbi:Cathepsin L [Folsomia candida]|uniref:Cathepsin L n=1 Tax=Folsomia candida TaxID=158441 RepID=A0A226DT56_FOLCA|nr:Cathepsin L [Folsomia candida]
MARLSVLTLFLVVAVFSAISLADKPDWVAFKKQHKKEYKSAEKEAKAKAKFDKNAARVDEHNKKFERGEVQYNIAINEFADQDAAEFHQTHHGLRPELRRNHSSRSVPHERYARQLPPASLDYRSTNKVSAVRNQANCGSCWAFASLAAVEIWDSGCGGGWPTNTFQWLQYYGGSKTDAAYPYTSGCCNSAGTCSGANAPVVQKVSGFQELSMPAPDATIKSYLAAHGPLAIAVSGEPWDPLYAGGYMSCPAGQAMDHAVLLVGYGVNTAGKNYWIVKNSWGTGWGDKGFAYILSGQANNVDCGISQYLATYPIIV